MDIEEQQLCECRRSCCWLGFSGLRRPFIENSAKGWLDDFGLSARFNELHDLYLQDRQGHLPTRFRYQSVLHKSHQQSLVFYWGGQQWQRMRRINGITEHAGDLVLGLDHLACFWSSFLRCWLMPDGVHVLKSIFYINLSLCLSAPVNDLFCSILNIHKPQIKNILKHSSLPIRPY